MFLKNFKNFSIENMTNYGMKFSHSRINKSYILLDITSDIFQIRSKQLQIKTVNAL